MQTHHGRLSPSPLLLEKKCVHSSTREDSGGETMPVSAYINLKLSLSLILTMMLNLTSNLCLTGRSFSPCSPKPWDQIFSQKTHTRSPASAARMRIRRRG